MNQGVYSCIFCHRLIRPNNVCYCLGSLAEVIKILNSLGVLIPPKLKEFLASLEPNEKEGLWLWLDGNPNALYYIMDEVTPPGAPKMVT